MNKPALLAAVTAGLVVGAVLGVYAPRWFASGAGRRRRLRPRRRPPSRWRNGCRSPRSGKCLSRAASRPWAACARTSPWCCGRKWPAASRASISRKGSPRGQALVRLDDSVPRAELAQARANLTLAQTHYRRAVELQGKGFVSQKARDESASSLKVQEAAVALAQARLDKMTITAPFSGIAGLRSVSVGDYVSQGQDLAPLEAIDPLKVDFRVPEMYLNKVGVGQQLTLRMDALPGEDRPGLVYAVSPLVDAGGRSILLRATVANRDAVLRPGMFARVQLQFAQDQALVVPEAALTPSGQAQYVYRVRDGVAERRAVTIGERREGLVEILTGVGEGDQLVVAGLQRVTDGAPVQIVGDGA